MEAVEFLPYIIFIPVSLSLTRVMRRDLASISAAVLTAYYASMGSTGLSAASALTIVLYSLTKVLFAHSARERRAVLMKLRHLFVASAVLASPIPVAYVALGSAFSLSPLESQTLAVVTTMLLYILMSTAVVPKTATLVNPRLWQTLRIEPIRDFLWTLGVTIGSITTFANVVIHGVLGLVIMFAYLTAILATRRLKIPTPGVVVSAVTGIGAVITYIAGYT